MLGRASTVVSNEIYSGLTKFYHLNNKIVRKMRKINKKKNYDERR